MSNLHSFFSFLDTLNDHLAQEAIIHLMVLDVDPSNHMYFATTDQNDFFFFLSLIFAFFLNFCIFPFVHFSTIETILAEVTRAKPGIAASITIYVHS